HSRRTSAEAAVGGDQLLVGSVRETHLHRGAAQVLDVPATRHVPTGGSDGAPITNKLRGGRPGALPLGRPPRHPVEGGLRTGPGRVRPRSPSAPPRRRTPACGRWRWRG